MHHQCPRKMLCYRIYKVQRQINAQRKILHQHKSYLQQMNENKGSKYEMSKMYEHAGKAYIHWRDQSKRGRLLHHMITTISTKNNEQRTMNHLSKDFWRRLELWKSKFKDKDEDVEQPWWPWWITLPSWPILRGRLLGSYFSLIYQVSVISGICNRLLHLLVLFCLSIIKMLSSLSVQWALKPTLGKKGRRGSVALLLAYK